MKRPIQWIVLLLALATGGGVLVVVGYSCLSFVLLVFFPDHFFPEHVDKTKVAYAAETAIDGYSFEVALFRNHPMLAEYRKILKVRQGEKLVLEREFIDTGGLASFYFSRKGNDIIVLDGIRNGFVLNVVSGEVSKVDLDSIPGKLREENIGRFMFVHQQKRTYRWVAQDDIPAAAK